MDNKSSLYDKVEVVYGKGNLNRNNIEVSMQRDPCEHVASSNLKIDNQVHVAVINIEEVRPSGNPAKHISNSYRHGNQAERERGHLEESVD